MGPLMAARPPPTATMCPPPQGQGLIKQGVGFHLWGAVENADLGPQWGRDLSHWVLAEPVPVPIPSSGLPVRQPVTYEQRADG